MGQSSFRDSYELNRYDRQGGGGLLGMLQAMIQQGGLEADAASNARLQGLEAPTVPQLSDYGQAPQTRIAVRPVDKDSLADSEANGDQGSLIRRLLALQVGQSGYQPTPRESGSTESPTGNPNFRQVSRAPIVNQPQEPIDASNQADDQSSLSYSPFGGSTSLDLLRTSRPGAAGKQVRHLPIVSGAQPLFASKTPLAQPPLWPNLPGYGQSLSGSQIAASHLISQAPANQGAGGAGETYSTSYGQPILSDVSPDPVRPGSQYAATYRLAPTVGPLQVDPWGARPSRGALVGGALGILGLLGAMILYNKKKVPVLSNSPPLAPEQSPTATPADGVGDDRKNEDDCVEERRVALEECLQASRNGWKGDYSLGIYGNPSKRRRTIEDCVRGRLSERCGGSPTAKPKPRP